jgi:hypothetical protein
MTPKPPVPVSGGSGTTNLVRPQLIPADAPPAGGTFQPTGTVQLPSRTRPPGATIPVTTTPQQ